jgi:hypothetical protein
MKVSMMGTGLPILQSRVKGSVSVDRRLPKSKVMTINRKLELETISYQIELLKAEKEAELHLRKFDIK